MNGRKNTVVLTAVVLAASLASAILTGAVLTEYYSRTLFRALGTICQEAAEAGPEAERAVASALKEYRSRQKTPLQKTRDFSETGGEENRILAYGYRQEDFLPGAGKRNVLFITACCFAGAALFLLISVYRHGKETERIRELTGYLEQINMGCGSVLVQVGEDSFSKLADELYKTVTELYQTRDAAVSARNQFAQNLSNIAHQIKTPVTSISLSVQMMEKEPAQKHLEQIKSQIVRLAHLEEALLLLSRVDAGTLVLERRDVDVFTMLVLAADSLQELFRRADVSVEIPELGEMAIYADMDWMMEAVMNLFKNCMEHTPPGGTVYCFYDQNPLYVQIRIWDTGNGFAKEDMPYLFERFYRGQREKSGGIGIGLTLSRAIVESQNGVLRAYNLPEGGACFEIRMYRHSGNFETGI